MKKFPEITIALLILFSFYNNATSQPFGRFSGFDGIDDKFSIMSAVIPDNSDFTIEFWLKTCTDSIPATGYAVLSNAAELEVNIFDGSGLRFHQLCLDDANIAFVCHQDHQYPSKDSQWHHIAVTYNNSTDHFEMYFDGIDGTLSSTPVYNFSPGFVFELGDGSWGQWFYNHFRGYIDELRVSNIIRYSGTFSTPQGPFSLDSFTVGLWHFEESNPVSMAIDESANNYHLTASGNLQNIGVDTIQIQGTGTLTAANTFNNYQWIDCSNGDTAISGANSFSYTPATTGSYALVVSDYICPIRSNCINVLKLSLPTIESKTGLAIYPNPTKGMVNIEIGANKEFSVELLDFSGKQLLIKKSIASLQLNMNDFATGIYLVRICTATENITQKIIHQAN
jgi:hypothetical protein